MAVDLKSDLNLLTHPFANSNAAKMLANAFDELRKARGLSQRQLAAMLGYKGSVMLSHMASGRIAVPVSRVSDFASLLGINEPALLLAALEQAYPDTNFRKILGPFVFEADRFESANRF